MYAAYALPSQEGDSMRAQKKKGSIGDGPKVDAERIVIPSIAARAIQVHNAVVAPSNEEVFRDLLLGRTRIVGVRHVKERRANRASHHDARDRAKEHGIGRKVRRKPVAALEQVPREYAEADNRRYIASPADVLCAVRCFRAGTGFYTRMLIRTI
jgi:hypothetical protein